MDLIAGGVFPVSLRVLPLLKWVGSIYKIIYSSITSRKSREVASKLMQLKG
jgi:hypothetical protein